MNGIWLTACATDAEVERFVKHSTIDKTFKELCKD